MSSILRHLKLIYKLLFFDKNEIYFLDSNKKIFQNKKKKSKLKKKYILIQVLNDYYYLLYYKKLILKNFYNSQYVAIGLWPYLYLPVRRTFKLIENIKIIYNNFFLFLLKKKWSILYKSIGIQEIKDLNTNKNNNFNKNYIFKSNKNLFKLKVKNILVGDLIHDTYIRYRAYPTVDLKDRFIYFYINKINECFENLKKLNLKYSFKFFFTSYATYIHHGIPVRYFLFNTMTKVFSGKNLIQNNKRLTKRDFLHTYDYKSFFKKKVLSKKNKFSFKKIKKILDLKYSGSNRYLASYMVTNPFSNINNSTKKKKEEKKLQNIDGVLFTQSIYDSPHAWGSMVFDDYYDWMISSFEYIRKNKLKIAIKPHPNAIKNQEDIEKLFIHLKKQYSDLIWLDENLTNKIIFKNIKFGISVTGTVLFELAWNNLLPISCGDSPYSYYNFTANAKSKKEYYNLLLNANKLKKKCDRRKLAYFYFCQNFGKHDSIKCNFLKKNNKKFFNNSYCLKKII